MGNRKFISLYLLMLIPAVSLIVGLSIAFYYVERQAVIENLQSAEKLRQIIKKTILEEEFQSIVSDLLILASHHEIELIANHSPGADYSDLTQEFYVFSKYLLNNS